MEIQCQFENSITIDARTFYTCYVEDQIIPANVDLKFVGRHDFRKSNNTVARIWFLNCKMTKFPQGLSKIFPNLKSFVILHTNLQSISRDDIAEYKNLERFSIGRSEIEFLPGNLFEDFRNLEEIGFCNNKLRIIEPNILDGFDRLNYVNFRDNPNYDKCFSVYKDYSNATLEGVKNDLFDKFDEFMKMNVNK